MFGLGLPQLILILAGMCFMVAGIYGLAPSLVTSKLDGLGGRTAPGKEPRLSKKQQKAQARAEALKLVQLKPQPQANPQPEPQIEEAPAVKVEAKVIPIAAEPEPAPVVVATLPVAKVEAIQPIRPETPALAVVPKPEPAVEADSNETVVVDQDFVDELFSEMFALRSTMAGLVDEVKQLRSEHRSRRFIVEEVVA